MKDDVFVSDNWRNIIWNNRLNEIIDTDELIVFRKVSIRENALYSFLNLLYIYLTPILSFHLINKIFIFHLQYYLSTFT